MRYQWDEISDEVVPATLDDDEGGWTVTRYDSTTTIHRSDRGHLSVTVEASDEDDAWAKICATPEYQQWAS